MVKIVTRKKPAVITSHVAIVPDGNGRWAEKHCLPRVAGHGAGIENMYRLLQYVGEYPIKYLTLYGFSTENWGRPEGEVKGLFGLVEDFVRRHIDEIHAKNIRLRHLGSLMELPSSLQRVMGDAVHL